jgi:hypothetical protein
MLALLAACQRITYNGGDSVIGPPLLLNLGPNCRFGGAKKATHDLASTFDMKHLDALDMIFSFAYLFSIKTQ